MKTTVENNITNLPEENNEKKSGNEKENTTYGNDNQYYSSKQFDPKAPNEDNKIANTENVPSETELGGKKGGYNAYGHEQPPTNKKSNDGFEGYKKNEDAKGSAFAKGYKRGDSPEKEFDNSNATNDKSKGNIERKHDTTKGK